MRDKHVHRNRGVDGFQHDFGRFKPVFALPGQHQLQRADEGQASTDPNQAFCLSFRFRQYRQFRRAIRPSTLIMNT